MWWKGKGQKYAVKFRPKRTRYCAFKGSNVDFRNISTDKRPKNVIFTFVNKALYFLMSEYVYTKKHGLSY